MKNLATDEARCGKPATHGAYCYRCAKRPTGFYEPSPNARGAAGTCVEARPASAGKRHNRRARP